MTTLIYCIVANNGNIANEEGMSELHGETGMEGRPLFMIAFNGHGAVCSELSASASGATVEGIQEFNRVIQHLADQVPAIPMRYGCIFEDDQEIVAYLANHNKTNDALLQRIRGCVEMSIRIVYAGLEPITDTNGDGIKSKTVTPSGRSYLDHRRKCYNARDKGKAAIEAVLSFHQRPFRGLYKAVSSEVPSAGAHSLSMSDMHPGPTHSLCLHFLVPRRVLDKFIATFNLLCSVSTHDLSLSGPWPPYNFVVDDRNDKKADLISAMGII